MKKLLPLFLLVFGILMSASSLQAQRILINEDFENAGFNADSLPTGWFQWDNDLSGQPGVEWAVRDSGTTYPGANPSAVIAHAYNNSVRSATIAWTAGNPVADDWMFTSALDIEAGDSLRFWMLHGSTPGITAYLDSMQVLVTIAQIPGTEIQKLATIVSNDSAGVPMATNDWKEVTFDLSAFAGQTVYVAFRYWMNTSVDGLWCNIDNVYIGNSLGVNVNPIGTNIPSKFALSQNYPNPFNPTTKIKFDLAKNSSVSLVIYNSLGQAVRTLVNDFYSAGYYEAEFNASDLPSGTYFYRITTDNFVETKKMLLVK